MTIQNTSRSPIDAVMAANREAANEALNLGIALTNTAMSFWTQSLGMIPAATLAAPPQNGGADRAANAREASSSREQVRSWYRPPYRSPFDPLFWLSPGHPADHLGDWMRLSAAMATAPVSLTALPGMPTATMPSMMPALPTAFWLEPMMAWSKMAMSHGWASASAAHLAPSINVTTLDKDYGAYRSAGGHAVATIVRDGAAARDSSLPVDFSALFSWPWAMMPCLAARR